MKIGLLGDNHLTNYSPIRRKDDYFQTHLGKLCQAFQIFRDHECTAVIQPGDFFDTPTVANRVKIAIIKLLQTEWFNYKPYALKPFVVYGQHDISGHSATTLPNSPLAVLEAAELITLLGPAPVMLNEDKGQQINLYGAPFGEEPPDVENTESFNILVTHRMIGDRPLWPGQVLEGPRNFLRKFPDYDLVVCGDYHFRFTEICNNRTIINPGAIIRKTIGKFDLELKPAVIIFDTETNNFEIIELKVGTIDDVFDLRRDIKMEEDGVLQFIERLQKSQGSQVAWKEVLETVLLEKKTSQSVKDIIDHVLEEVTND